MNNSQIRKLNIQTLIAAARLPTTKAFCEQFELNESYVSQIINASRNAGPRFARQLETITSHPNGWLDMPHPDLWEKHNILESNNSVKSPNNKLYITGDTVAGKQVITERREYIESAMAILEGAYLLRVIDTDAAPHYRNGFAILCAPGSRLAPPYECYVQFRDGRRAIRRVNELGDRLLLENPADRDKSELVDRADVEFYHLIHSTYAPHAILED